MPSGISIDFKLRQMPNALSPIFVRDNGKSTETKLLHPENADRPMLVIPSGKRIGGYNGAENVWPYRDINSWSGVAGKPLTDITVNGSTIELIYINDPDTNTAVELPEVQSGAVKMVRDGKMVIVHGDAVYSILGVRE